MLRTTGPYHTGEGFGLGFGGGWYLLRLDLDSGTGATSSLVAGWFGRLRFGGHRSFPGVATRVRFLLLVLLLPGCVGQAPVVPDVGAPLGSRTLVERSPAQFERELETLRGQVVVVNFWASWCVPCREELPALQRIAEEYQGRDVTVLGVASDDEVAAADELLRSTGVTFPTVFDPGGVRTGIARDWSVTGLPQTWVVAPDGTRAGRIVGIVTEDELRERIDPLLPAGSPAR